MKIATFSPADQENVNAAQVVELVLENHQDTIQDLSITGRLWPLFCATGVISIVFIL
jgi:hypothetical protein